jgi:dTDP-glucose pyrophosphorylase
MKDWRRTLISPKSTILKAIEIIDISTLQVALVVDEQNHLLGILTDGDIRRAILQGISLENPAERVMQRKFTTVGCQASNDFILSLMRERDLKQIPVLDDNGCVVGLKVLVDMIQTRSRENWVVIMAGGLGSRLQPLTDHCPKPLLKIGSKPILEMILENLIAQGFQKYFISVNYKGEMIESFVGNGQQWGVDIEYLREDRRMGTGGALGLLPQRPQSPFIVMNADVLTKINLDHLLHFHISQKAKATMCVRDYHFQVPYGVVRTDEHHLVSIDEKPVQRFFVNAGIYVLEPGALDFAPLGEPFDMTSLFENLLQERREVAAFPIREYWLDIGRTEDLERANGEFADHFLGGHS